jgi:hypothetical protein
MRTSHVASFPKYGGVAKKKRDEKQHLRISADSDSPIASKGPKY